MSVREKKLDIDVLLAHISIWVFVPLSLWSVSYNLAHFGETITAPENAHWWHYVFTTAVFALAIETVWEVSMVPWRTPMAVMLAIGVLYDVYVFTVVGHEVHDVTRFVLDFAWMMGLLSLYKFPPVLKEVA